MNLPLRLKIFGFVAVVFLAGSVTAQTVANDDAYTLDRSQVLEVFRNDQNLDGTMIVSRQPAHGERRLNTTPQI